MIKDCEDDCSGNFEGNDPNIFERFPNYLNNTTANQSYSITALPYDPSNENDINAIRFLFPNPNNPDGSGGGTPLTWLETKQQLLSTVPTNAFLFAPGQGVAIVLLEDMKREKVVKRRFSTLNPLSVVFDAGYDYEWH